MAIDDVKIDSSVSEENYVPDVTDNDQPDIFDKKTENDDKIELEEDFNLQDNLGIDKALLSYQIIDYGLAVDGTDYKEEKFDNNFQNISQISNNIFNFSSNLAINGGRSLLTIGAAVGATALLPILAPAIATISGASLLFGTLAAGATHLTSAAVVNSASQALGGDVVYDNLLHEGLAGMAYGASMLGFGFSALTGAAKFAATGVRDALTEGAIFTVQNALDGGEFNLQRVGTMMAAELALGWAMEGGMNGGSRLLAELDAFAQNAIRGLTDDFQPQPALAGTSALGSSPSSVSPDSNIVYMDAKGTDGLQGGRHSSGDGSKNTGTSENSSDHTPTEITEEGLFDALHEADCFTNDGHFILPTRQDLESVYQYNQKIKPQNIGIGHSRTGVPIQDYRIDNGQDGQPLKNVLPQHDVAQSRGQYYTVIDAFSNDGRIFTFYQLALDQLTQNVSANQLPPLLIDNTRIDFEVSKFPTDTTHPSIYRYHVSHNPDLIDFAPDPKSRANRIRLVVTPAEMIALRELNEIDHNLNAVSQFLSWNFDAFFKNFVQEKPEFIMFARQSSAAASVLSVFNDALMLHMVAKRYGSNPSPDWHTPTLQDFEDAMHYTQKVKAFLFPQQNLYDRNNAEQVFSRLAGYADRAQSGVDETITIDYLFDYLRPRPDLMTMIAFHPELGSTYRSLDDRMATLMDRLVAKEESKFSAYNQDISQFMDDIEIILPEIKELGDYLRENKGTSSGNFLPKKAKEAINSFGLLDILTPLKTSGHLWLMSQNPVWKPIFDDIVEIDYALGAGHLKDGYFDSYIPVEGPIIHCGAKHFLMDFFSRDFMDPTNMAARYDGQMLYQLYQYFNRIYPQGDLSRIFTGQ